MATSWGKARKSCMDKKIGDLVDVKNEAENTFVKEKFGGNNWLGLSGCGDSDLAIKTCNLQSMEINWKNFACGEPDNRPKFRPNSENSDYAILNKADGKWEDKPKSETHSYICKKSVLLFPCEAKKPCKNNSDCENINNTDYRCICKGMFWGKNCEHDKKRK